MQLTRRTDLQTASYDPNFIEQSNAGNVTSQLLIKNLSIVNFDAK